MKSLAVVRRRPFKNSAAHLVAVAFSLALATPALGQSLTAEFADDFSLTSLGSIGYSTALGFTPGVSNKLYIANGGIKSYDYDPVAGIGNGQSALHSGHNALGFDFHQDPTWGTVMYYGRDVGGASETGNLSVHRVNDSNGNGVFGDPGDTLNQVIVDNLKARGEGGHRLNNLKIRGNSLYLNIGSRTQNGGVDVDGRLHEGGGGSTQQRSGLQAGNGYTSNGVTSRMGEFAYTGALTYIKDLTQVGGGTNAAGFDIDDTLEAHATATDFFASPSDGSSKDGKLVVYATGFRNNFGLGISDEGEIFVAENQNEYPDPRPPDRLIKVENFKGDFGYQKSNGWIDDARTPPDLTQPATSTSGLDGSNGTPYFSTLGTYRDPTGSPTAGTAAAAGYFQQTDELDLNGDSQIDLDEILAAAFAPIPDNGSSSPAVTGLDFLPGHVGRQDLAGDIVVGTFVHNNLVVVDKDSGNTQTFVTGFTNPVDVQRDPFGNLLAIGTGGNLIQIAPDSFVTGSLKLLVNADTGEASIVNTDETPVELRGYSILSSGGSLNETGWQSLADNPEPAYDGWEEANPTATALSELNPLDSLTVTSTTEVPLGSPVAPLTSSAPFGTPAVNPDVRFEFTTADKDVLHGAVQLTGLMAVNNLLLTVNADTGEAELMNSSQTTVRLRGYSIHSESGSVKPGDGDWLSLSDQAVPGAQEANPTSEDLSELVPAPADPITLGPGQTYSLGDLFTTKGEGGTQDLELGFVIEELGPVEGDYNEDGVVDAADYTIWRDALGSATALPNEAATPGMVSLEDYAVWKGNFGSAGPASLAVLSGVVRYENLLPGQLREATAPVPEPATAALLTALLLVFKGTAVIRPRKAVAQASSLRNHTLASMGPRSFDRERAARVTCKLPKT